MNGNGATLDLDSATAHLVDALARTWGVSKEEAVRRAVAQAQATSPAPNPQRRLEAFKELQRQVGLTPEKAAEWQNTVYAARR